MNVTLPVHLAEFVRKQVEQGRFESPTDAISDALRLLEKRDQVANLDWSILGGLGGANIAAIAFIVMMEAAKSAQEDLKSIMAEVKAINEAKAAMRRLIDRVNRDLSMNAGQRDRQPPLHFGPSGIGSIKGYAKLPVPHPDPTAPGGIKHVPTKVHEGSLTDVCTLKAIRDALKGELDSMAEMGDMESLRLQMAMDRLSKMMTTLSNMLKKISDTANTITSNLK